MKWLISTFALLVVVVFLLLQRDSVRVSYVNGLPAYSHLPFREYLFQEDCYIIKLDGSPAAYPLVASHLQLASLPSKVDEHQKGSKFPGGKILGTVKTGSRVKLISVRREQGRSETLISFEILFLDEAERPYPRLDARLLLDHSPEARGEPPVFLDTVVVPRVKL